MRAHGRVAALPADHTEPDAGRQPRERPVPCGVCALPTFNVSAICGRPHGAGAH